MGAGQRRGLGTGLRLWFPFNLVWLAKSVKPLYIPSKTIPATAFKPHHTLSCDPSPRYLPNPPGTAAHARPTPRLHLLPNPTPHPIPNPQGPDQQEDVQIAMETCPVDCIHCGCHPPSPPFCAWLGWLPRPMRRRGLAGARGGSGGCLFVLRPRIALALRPSPHTHTHVAKPPAARPPATRPPARRLADPRRAAPQGCRRPSCPFSRPL
jgi:hypothetical protein